MELDKIVKLGPGEQIYAPDRLDGSYLEFGIFSLWKINLLENLKIKAALAKNFHIQPSELDNMYMWEFEAFVKAASDIMEDENNSQKAEMDKYNIKDYMDSANPKNIGKMMESSTPKMPNINIGNMNMGNMKFP